jgi:hypothetical protein
MRRLLTIYVGAVFLTLPSLALGQTHVFGGFSSTGYTASAINRLYDDGLHGDGAAGDGVYGAEITVDKAAGKYSWCVGYWDSYMGPTCTLPYCVCVSGLAGSAYLWTTGPGDVIHFTMDQRSSGWYPTNGIACDHGLPTSSPLQVVVGYSEGEVLGTAYAATPSGAVWQSVVQFATPAHARTPSRLSTGLSTSRGPTTRPAAAIQASNRWPASRPWRRTHTPASSSTRPSGG